MKRLISVMVIIVALFLGYVTSVNAEGIGANSRLNIAKKTAGFVAGLASGIFFHETGHEIVARLENTDMGWSGVFNSQWRAPSAHNTELRHIALAGFGAQIVSTEIILGMNQIPKDNAYVLGWLAFNVFNSLCYPLLNELRGGYGDIETLRKAGIDTAYVEIGLIAHGLLTAYRIYRNPQFIPYIKATKEELILGISWSF